MRGANTAVCFCVFAGEGVPNARPLLAQAEVRKSVQEFTDSLCESKELVRTFVNFSEGAQYTRLRVGNGWSTVTTEPRGSAPRGGPARGRVRFPRDEPLTQSSGCSAALELEVRYD